jgi:hypothetical protein
MLESMDEGKDDLPSPWPRRFSTADDALKNITFTAAGEVDWAVSGVMLSDGRYISITILQKVYLFSI